MANQDDGEELPAAVAAFVERAEAIYDEYDEGYLDPDAALERLGDHVSELRDVHEASGDGER